MPKPEHSHHKDKEEQDYEYDHGQQTEDIYGDRFVIPEQADLQVREALSHCPQCGSGKFTEYRKDQPTAT
jgi:hypothetical protein